MNSSSQWRFPRIRKLGIGLILLVGMGCAQEMDDQAKLGPQEASKFFTDSVGSQALPEHTIAADPGTRPQRFDANTAEPLLDSAFLTGLENGKPLEALPESLLKRMSYAEILRRGQKQFGISCVPCHDHTGSGNGIVPRRGFPFPPSYHSDRLRSKPLGFIFLTATKGDDNMPPYGDLISPEDRWAVAAYVRALQFSQHAPADQLESRDKAALKEGP